MAVQAPGQGPARQIVAYPLPSCKYRSDLRQSHERTLSVRGLVAQNPAMAVPGCGEFTHCECGFEPPPTPDRARDRPGKTNRRARMCRWATDPRYGYPVYSRSDLRARASPKRGRRVSEMELCLKEMQ